MTLNMSSYANKLPSEARKRYQQKIRLTGMDLFVLCEKQQPTTVAVSPASTLPRVDASDLVSYLVLQTSFVTAKQFKAHKSMEAYNQFVCGWVKDVRAWNVASKCVVTGRVSHSAASKWCNLQLSFSSGTSFSALL